MPVFGEIVGFSGFFLILGANHFFWVKYGGWYVNMRGLGGVDKKKTLKNEHKLA